MDTNTVAWFEVATGDADGAQEFYGELFGWRFAADPDMARVGMDYRLITYPGGEAPVGGIFGTGGEPPDHAVFTVAVAGMAETCAQAEKLGGTVVQAVTEPGAGPAFAYLRDRAGNLIGIFTPAAKPG
jgi:predicted enzyme related to lactoylglutathione lyase